MAPETKAMVDLFDGKLSELEICDPTWLYAGRLTDAETGESWRYVYRSTLLRTDSEKFRPVLEWLDGATPIGNAHVAADPDLMYGTGELTLWEP